MLRNYHIDAALTNISVSYRPSGFIADILAPVVKVDKQSNKYFVWDKVDGFRNNDDLRAPGAVAKTIDFGLSADQYFAEEHSLRTRILWTDIANADVGLNLEITKARKLKESVLLAREYRVAKLLTNPASYDTGMSVALSGTSKWSDPAYAGDPVAEIDAWKAKVRKATGVTPNTIVIPEAVAAVLANNPKFRERFKYTAEDITSGGLPKVIRDLRVIVPGVTGLDTGLSASTPLDDVWGNNIIICYTNPSATPNSEDFSLAYTFRVGDLATRKYENEEEKARYVETEVMEDVKIISKAAGFLVTGVV